MQPSYIDKGKYKKMIESVQGRYYPSDFFTTARLLNYVLSKNKDPNEVNFLEIGFYKGKSLIPIYHYFYNRITTFYGCDTFLNDGRIFKMFKSNLSRFCSSDKLEIIKGDSLALSNHFADKTSKKFVYCSIASDNQYKNVISNLQFCAERLESGGIIVLDDVFQYTSPEVSNALYNFLDEYKQFHIVYILFNKVILSTDRSIVENTYEEPEFCHQYIHGRMVNVINKEADSEYIASFHPDFRTRISVLFNKLSSKQ